EGGYGRGVGPAHMQQGRQLKIHRHLKLGLEQALLLLPIRVINIIIQPEFTNGATARITRMLVETVAQQLQILRLVLIEKNRVQTKSRVQPVVGAGHRPDPVPITRGNAHQQDAPHTEALAFSQYRIAISVEIRKVQMGMCIDIDAHGYSMGIRHGAGKRSGKEAGPWRACPHRVNRSSYTPRWLGRTGRHHYVSKYG